VEESWPDRKNEVTLRYVEVVKKVASQVDAGLVDVRQAFEGKDLSTHLADGLHLTAAGYETVFNEFMVVLRKKYPGLDPDTLSQTLPGWDNLEMRAANTIAAEEIRKRAGYA